MDKKTGGNAPSAEAIQSLAFLENCWHVSSALKSMLWKYWTSTGEYPVLLSSLPLHHKPKFRYPKNFQETIRRLCQRCLPLFSWPQKGVWFGLARNNWESFADVRFPVVGHLQQARSRPLYSGLGVWGRPKSIKSKLFTMVVRLRLG